jgi:LacI family transcriptional regulator
VITMTDVARRAGVSISTVSHVINGTRFVKAETRETVLSAIQELGYTHNTIARSLVTHSTSTIGVAIAGISNFYFADMIASIEAALARAGYTMLLAETRDEPDQEYRVVQAIQQRRVDGIILAPTLSGDTRTLRHLLDLGVPTVLVDRFASDSFDQVGSENRASTASLVLHLSGLGHKRIGLISGIGGVRTTEERVEGYRRGLEESGLPFDPLLIASGRSHADPAEAAVRYLLNLSAPPTALVIANNHMTIGALRALRRLKVRIPEDIALVCFDDFEWADIMRPRLTAMAQPIREIGLEATRLLITRIADPRQKPRKARLRPVFHNRESCGCPIE